MTLTTKHKKNLGFKHKNEMTKKKKKYIQTTHSIYCKRDNSVLFGFLAFSDTFIVTL